MKYHLTDEDYATAEKRGLNRNLVYQRFYVYGWSAEDAISEPKRNAGIIKALHEKALAAGIDITYDSIRHRYKNGWTEDEIVNLPVIIGKGGQRHVRKMNELYDLAKENGICKATYAARRNRGWNKEDAATKPVDKRFRRRDLA